VCTLTSWGWNLLWASPGFSQLRATVCQQNTWVCCKFDHFRRQHLSFLPFRQKMHLLLFKAFLLAKPLHLTPSLSCHTWLAILQTPPASSTSCQLIPQVFFSVGMGQGLLHDTVWVPCQPLSCTCRSPASSHADEKDMCMCVCITHTHTHTPWRLLQLLSHCVVTPNCVPSWSKLHLLPNLRLSVHQSQV
jgi:hypothetical protein